MASNAFLLSLTSALLVLLPLISVSAMAKKTYIVHMKHQDKPGGGFILEFFADADPGTVEKLRAVFADVDPRTEEKILAGFADVGPTSEKFQIVCIGEKVAEGFAKAFHEGGSFRCVIPQFKDQGGNFTTGNGTDGERSGRFDFACYINKPRYTEGLVGKHLGFGQIVEAVTVVKALLDVVTALERAGWRKSAIIILSFIMIIIIKATG